MKINVRKSLFWLALVALILNVVCIFNVSALAESSDRYSAGYGGATPYAMTTISDETVEFTHREYELIQTVNTVPFYTQTGTLTNGCGAVAGSIVVGFYDKYYEELIPNYTTYISTGRYKGNDSKYIPQLINEMYTLMRTNVDDVGVSQTDCLNGLKSYVQGKNRNLGYTNIRNNNKVDETLFRNAINANKPVILFCDKTDVYTMALSSNSERIVGTNLTDSGHIVVACGLYIVKYYNANGLFRTDKYINVATGLTTYSAYFLKLESTDWCNGAYAVSVN